MGHITTSHVPYPKLFITDAWRVSDFYQSLSVSVYVGTCTEQNGDWIVSFPRVWMQHTALLIWASNWKTRMSVTWYHFHIENYGSNVKNIHS